MTPGERERVNRELTKIWKNLLIISVAFLFLFTAFHGLQNLQSTVNASDGLGPISLAIVYIGIALSSLIVPPYILNRLGCKQTLIVCMSVYALYMLVHFLPAWHSLLPASLLLGIAASALWAANATFLTELGIRFAYLNVEAPNVVMVRFFGIFFMIHHLGQVFGNVISSGILALTLPPSLPLLDEVDPSCGHLFTQLTANLSETAERNLARPSRRGYLAVCAAYFCCALVSVLIITFFLNPLKKDSESSREKPRFQLDVWNKTLDGFRKPKNLLLIPLTIFNGMEQAFIAAEFTKAYVGCCLGVGKIGYVLMCFGISDAVCSFVFGPLIRLFGRMPLFMFAAVVDMLMIFTLLVWPPNPSDTTLFYVIAAAWGMADGVWNTQINGLWVVLFSSNLEVAFANYRLWESVGFTIAFLLTPFLPTSAILYILLSVLLVGMIGYGIIELWEPIKEKVQNLFYTCVDVYDIYIKKKRSTTITTP